MSGATGIEWTDTTWNPVRGCSRVSEGCRNCYAEKMAARFSGPGLAFEGFAELHKSSRVPPRYQGLNVETGEVEYSAPRRIPARSRWTGKVELIPEKLAEPLHWKKPQRVFVNSMSDLFHESLSFYDIAAVFGVMAACSHLTFQVLTKRPERAAEWFRWVEAQRPALIAELVKQGCAWPDRNAYSAESVLCAFLARDALGEVDGSLFAAWPLPNVWLGTSVEDQATANERIPHLLRCPAAVRFLSCEPLLGWVDLQDLVVDDGKPGEWHADALLCDVDAEDDEGFNGATIDWVIAGGESGPGARPMHPDWARSIRDQCVEAGVSFFFKQWGSWQHGSEPGKRNLIVLTDGSTYETHLDSGSVESRHLNSMGGWKPGLNPTIMANVGKKASGRLLDGREWSQYPFPEVARAEAELEKMEVEQLELLELGGDSDG